MDRCFASGFALGHFVSEGNEVLVGADLISWTPLVAEKPRPITICRAKRVKPLSGVYF